MAFAWEGLDPRRVVDVHVHVVGLGAGGTGCFIHPDGQSLTSPFRAVKTRVYKGAAGIYDDARADALYMERLRDLVTHQTPRGRFLLLAFDQHHTLDGAPDPANTEFHTPNDYVLRLARERPDLFLACASVHPYRKDAVAELSRVRKLGAVALKWLPNAMGIDPSHERCDPLYEALARLRIPLITHAGEEKAVHAEEAQALGNPLHLRRALRMGVKVVVAHCAGLGSDEDLDQPPGADGKRPRATSYSLFRRLAAERHAGALYADVSAMTLINRCKEPLAETLGDAGLHPRLVNGSDYPLPAIDILIQTGTLEDLGYIDAREREALEDLFLVNPLTFDFVIKRLIRVVRDGNTLRFPASVFESAHLFPPA